MPAHKKEVPAEGTIRAEVFRRYGMSRPTIAEEVSSSLGRKVSLAQVTNSINGLRSSGKLPETTDEEKKRVLRESHYFASGSIWPIIAPYETLGFTTTEIVAAARLIHNIEVLPLRVYNAAKNARSVEGRQKRLDPTQRGTLVKRTRHSSIPISERVGLVLDTVGWLFLQPHMEWPRSQEVLIGLSGFLRDQNLISADAEKFKSIVDLYEREKRPLPTVWTQVSILKEQAFVASAISSEQDQLISHRRDEEYLIQLRDARIRWKESGDRSSYSAVIERIASEDETFFERKRAAIEVIRDSLQAGKTDEEVAEYVRQREGYIEHGEVSSGERDAGSH